MGIGYEKDVFDAVKIDLSSKFQQAIDLNSLNLLQHEYKYSFTGEHWYCELPML